MGNLVPSACVVVWIDLKQRIHIWSIVSIKISHKDRGESVQPNWELGTNELLAHPSKMSEGRRNQMGHFCSHCPQLGNDLHSWCHLATRAIMK